MKPAAKSITATELSTILTNFNHVKIDNDTNVTTSSVLSDIRLEMEKTKHAMELKLLETRKEHQIELIKLQEESAKRQAETTQLLLKSQEESAMKIANVVQSITNRQPDCSLSEPDPYDYFSRRDVFSNYPYNGNNRFTHHEN